jgi:glyoxylase-like metal-dependent hydrolase (beta-lactamase superfamily II)
VPSRRTFIGNAGAGLAGLALGPLPRLALADIGRATLAPGLTLLTGAGGNLLALETDAGLVLVDSGTAAEAADLAAALGALSGQTVAAVFNTHWHPEQVGANAVFGEAGASIYAQVKTRQRLASGYYLPQEERYEPALPAPGVPTETFFEHAAYTVGGSAVECAYLVQAHTDGDIAVTFPDANVVAIGGVISPPERDPEFDWFGGGWLGGRLDAYELLLGGSDANTRFVPARGPVIGQAELRAEQEMLLELFDRMVEHVRLGETPRDMLEVGVLEGLSRNFDDPYRLIYDLNKGFWAHQNKLMHDIV